MAINPANPILSGSATATNGSPTISVSGNVDCSFVTPGVVLQIGTNHLVPAISGTAPVGGVSAITLAANWSYATVTGELIAWNTIEGLSGLIQRQRDALASQSAIGSVTGFGVIEKTGEDEFQTVPIGTAGKASLASATAADLRAAAQSQQADATLTAIAGVTTAANTYIYFTGADVAAVGTITPTGRSVLSSADAAGVRTAIGAAATSHTHTLSNITQSGATTGQVATWSGTAWTPTTISTGSTIHNDLMSRDAADAHPLDSITGLVTALAGKASTDAVTITVNGLMLATDKVKLDGIATDLQAQVSRAKLFGLIGMTR